MVVFDPANLNPEYWNNLSEKDKLKYYNPLGYGCNKPKFFIFICEINNAPGHCVLLDMNTDLLVSMRHTKEF